MSEREGREGVARRGAIDCVRVLLASFFYRLKASAFLLLSTLRRRSERDDDVNAVRWNAAST